MPRAGSDFTSARRRGGIERSVRSACFSIRLVECLLDIADALLHGTFHLFGRAFDLLRLVSGDFACFLLHLASNALCSAFDLIRVHGVILCSRFIRAADVTAAPAGGV